MPTTLKRRVLLKAGGAALALATTGTARAATGRVAPRWDIVEWLNGDGGNVDSLRGKVVVIDFFQLWCPGCNGFSGPLMKQWQTHYADEVAAGRIVFRKIHTVFEGHDYQTMDRLKGYLERKEIWIPVGIDRHIDGQRVPETMRRYRTRGTPEMAIIDPDGMIGFQQFGGFDPEPVQTMIDWMLRDTQA